ncbi:protein SIEVE ELEMENT OCCLUSION B-like [Henckelia pumila]|uniref:protein SIEVE ELEMENT OCCLUSION B-like n=1 Tax=Henckelia pumila TaxID=405737 RepID=UPI003C6E27E3
MLKTNPRSIPLLPSNENTLRNQIVATHALGYEDFDVRPVLDVVEGVFRHAQPLRTSDDSIILDYEYPTVHGEEAYANRGLDIVEALASPINNISNEMFWKCGAGVEVHSITMDILSSLSSYSWDAKLVITLAAFAINYGEFCLVFQNQKKDPLAKDIARLKSLPDSVNQSADLRDKFESIPMLLETALKVTGCVKEFRDLPAEFLSPGSGEMAAPTAHIPMAVYLIIKGLVSCASLLLNLVGRGHKYSSSTAESMDILDLSYKLSILLEELQSQLHMQKELVERRMKEYKYTAFKKLMEAKNIDNMKVFRAMFRTRDDQMPLYLGSTKRPERLEVLSSKLVLLLITDLNIPHEELSILHSIYSTKEYYPTRQEYEVLWLPILDSSSTSMDLFQDTEFRNLLKKMPWHSLDRSALIEKEAVRYIREVWNFAHRPMLVVLDPQAKLSNLDALPMMWIWGSNGFPFTKQREMVLWAESSWNLELLADSIDPRFTDWIRNNSIGCLFGGDDIEWVRRFTQSTRAAAAAMGIPLEMLYVGKSNSKDKVRRCHDVIDREKLSHTFPLDSYNEYIWFFWTRLMSMLNSKKGLGMSAESDTVMQEILSMLTFDSGEDGWAVFSRGNHEMTKGKADVLLPVLDNYPQWAHKVDHDVDKFVYILDEETRRVRTEHHCNSLILPEHAGYESEFIVCSECGKSMDQYVMYRCCTD